MKSIGMYNFDSQFYSELNSRLKLLDINIVAVEDGQEENSYDLYIFNIDNHEEFSRIKTDRPFIIISSVSDPKLLMQSSKLGALDYIHKPFVNIELTIKRIRRILEKDKYDSAGADALYVKKYTKLIDSEIKRAKRYSYPLSLVLIELEPKVNNETLEKLISEVKEDLRDSDSCMQYSESNIILVLPFVDREGSSIVVNKITNLLNTKGYQGYYWSTEYPKDGTTREKLITNLKEEQIIKAQ